MSRRLRVLVALVLVSFAFTAAACADAATAPHINAQPCDVNSSNTC